MSAHCISAAAADGSRSVARAIYFSSEQHTLFGWLHLPDGASSAGTGLVICNPFGYEAICSHRSLRAFAEAAAARGLPTLRFDYRGTGNSADLDPQSNQLAAWSSDVAAASAELQRRTGVARVCLIGFRLGVPVAALAAAKCAAVQALIAVAPLTSGKRYLREIRTIQMAAGQNVSPGGTDAVQPLEISGFSLAPATLSALTETDLLAQNLPNLPDVLVLDREESPGARPWADALGQRGSRVEYVARPGFVRMMMTAPHLSVIPQAMLAATRDWLTRYVAHETPAVAPGHASGTADLEPGERFALAGARPDGDITESPLVIPGTAGLFGIVTEPPRGELRRRGVILLNAGATHHVGPNRMYVTLARRWAARGYVVMRLDLAGLGDSAAVPGAAEIEPYPPDAIEQVRASVECMRSRYGIANITLGGLCSGAYHALRAAVAGVPVSRVMLVNPLNFFWRDGMNQADLQWLGFVHNPDAYRRQTIPSRFWKKLLAGQVNVPRLIKVHAQYGWELLEWAVRDVARGLHIPLPGDLGNQLEEVVSRGVDIVFVFSRGDPGLALLRHQAGSAVRRLDRHCRVHTIDGADHIFSQSGPRAALEALLSEELFQRVLAVGTIVSPATGSRFKQEQLR